jgi:hypothetical protein
MSKAEELMEDIKRLKATHERWLDRAAETHVQRDAAFCGYKAEQAAQQIRVYEAELRWLERERYARLRLDFQVVGNAPER